jgi:hypothetical protein
MLVIILCQWFPTRVSRRTKCCKEVSGVTPNIEFTALYSVSLSLLRAPNIVIFSKPRVPPKFFKALKSALNQKRLKTLLYMITFKMSHSLTINKYKWQDSIIFPMAFWHKVILLSSTYCIYIFFLLFNWKNYNCFLVYSI